MNLKDLLAKDHNEWTEAERQFVADNKAELTAEQKTKFGFEEKPAEKPKEDAPAPTPPADPAKPVEASEGAQTATISASELKSLQETAAQYRREKAEGVVDEHVKRGAIKQDQAEKWTTTLLASEGDARKNLEAMLTALPGSAIIASENGTDKDAAKSTTSALDELDTKAKGIVSASEGKVSLGDAYKQAQDQDTDLRDRVNKERSANQAVA